MRPSININEHDPRHQDPQKYIEMLSIKRISERSARRLFSAVIGEGECERQPLLQSGLIPRELKAKWEDLPRLVLEDLITSTVDGFQKIRFRTHDGLAIETVLIPLDVKRRMSICLSSQVGCVMGCQFCATARIPKRRNLETWEIVDQYLQGRKLIQESGRHLHSAVFMGMGEPFLNYRRVIDAAEILSYPVRNAISARSITVSTVGLVPEIHRFVEEKQPYRLSISIASADNAKRARLVPLAARWKIEEVMTAAREYVRARNERINLAYVCISGENVSIDDAKLLGEVIGDLSVRLDLIDVCDPTGNFKPPTQEERSLFRDALRIYLKQPVVRRYSGGQDIMAACGTLAGQ